MFHISVQNTSRQKDDVAHSPSPRILLRSSRVTQMLFLSDRMIVLFVNAHRVF